LYLHWPFLFHHHHRLLLLLLLLVLRSAVALPQVRFVMCEEDSLETVMRSLDRWAQIELGQQRFGKLPSCFEVQWSKLFCFVALPGDRHALTRRADAVHAQLSVALTCLQAGVRGEGATGVQLHVWRGKGLVPFNCNAVTCVELCCCCCCCCSYGALIEGLEVDSEFDKWPIAQAS
jgi:hypothetical protein